MYAKELFENNLFMIYYQYMFGLCTYFGYLCTRGKIFLRWDWEDG